jgi:hypothetical protein
LIGVDVAGNVKTCSKAVITNLEYAYPQRCKPGHLGVSEKIE